MKEPLKDKILGMLTAALLATLASTASAQLFTTANGPYYATPSWDQNLTINRFVVLANWDSQAVLDRETGLVWVRNPHPGGNFLKTTWTSALDSCIRLSVHGKWGWRLPAIQELLSLKQLPAGHPFIDVQPDYYWSATSGAFDAHQARTGAPLGLGPSSALKSDQHYAWCVRGGAGADVQ